MTPTLTSWFVFGGMCVLTAILAVVCWRCKSENRVAWLISLAVTLASLALFSHVAVNFQEVADWVHSENAGSKYPSSRDISRYLEWRGDAVHMRDDPAALKLPLGWAIYVGDYNTGRGARPVEIGQPFPVDPGDSEVFYRFRQDPEYNDGKRRNPTAYRAFTR